MIGVVCHLSDSGSTHPSSLLELGRTARSLSSSSLFVRVDWSILVSLRLEAMSFSTLQPSVHALLSTSSVELVACLPSDRRDAADRRDPLTALDHMRWHT